MGAQAPAAQRAASVCHYQVLGLRPGCSKQEVKAAYRSLARRLHPDALPPAASPAELAAAARSFHAVREAYECLTDRLAHDPAQGTAWAPAGAAACRPAQPWWERPAATAATPPPRPPSPPRPTPPRPTPPRPTPGTAGSGAGTGAGHWAAGPPAEPLFEEAGDRLMEVLRHQVKAFPRAGTAAATVLDASGRVRCAGAVRAAAGMPGVFRVVGGGRGA